MHRVIRVAVVAVTLAVLGTTARPVGAETLSQTATIDDPAQALVERFAPVIMVKEQSDDCDTDGEPYRPGAVDIILDNPEVALRQVGRDDIVVTRAPSAADLAGLGEGFYLDFPGSSLAPGCIYEKDFRKYTRDHPPTVYAHIVQPPDAPDRLVVQYWFYWYYNDWNNKHESDWEGIALLFEASSVEEALTSEPIEVGYAQHEGGERAAWSADKLERDGDRPVVYSSSGSHASYFDSEVYLGRGASEGFGCDDTSGPSTRVDPEVVLLPDAVDSPADPLGWLSFEGRWGERQNGAFNGPTGPALKERWLDPLPWFDDLRSSAVVIPAGDSAAASVISAFCGLVEGGSRALIVATVSPTGILVLGLLVAWLLRYAIGRTDWSPVAVEPLIRRRRAGQIIRATATIYRRTPGIFVAIGSVYLPAAIAAGLIAAVARAMPLLGDFLALTRSSSGSNLVMAALAGGFTNLAAYFAVNALTADYRLNRGRGIGDLRASARRTWRRRRRLLGSFARSYATVAVLLATVVGIPWAVRQLVRYQFVPHTIVHDDDAEPLRRSSELVRGRWFHTMFVTATLNGLVFGRSMGLSLLLLVLAPGLPLWLFSGLVTLVYVVVVPVAAIAMHLLYGDAVAAEESAPDAELVHTHVGGHRTVGADDRA